ncbi:unnamed protein product [Pedinophyceae sp. YPF-701]|nr:unnamed protein product [Pedinophyceae sp. YPF-701]
MSGSVRRKRSRLDEQAQRDEDQCEHLVSCVRALKQVRACEDRLFAHTVGGIYKQVHAASDLMRASPALREKFVEHGGLEVLASLLKISMLQSPFLDEGGIAEEELKETKTLLHHIEKDTCFCISMVLADGALSSNQTVIARLGALPHVVRLLRPVDYVPIGATGGAPRRAADAVYALAVDNNEVKHDLRREGAIPALLDLADHSCVKVRRAAVMALRVLAFKNDENKDAIVLHGGLETLVPLLRAEDESVYTEAIGVVGNLVHSTPLMKGRVLLTDGALQAIIRLLRPHCTDDARREAALLMGQFAADERFRPVIAQRGAVASLVQMLDPHGPEVLQEMSTFALGRLCLDRDTQAGLLESAALPHLLALLQSPLAEVQHNASFVLYGLSDNSDNVPELIRGGLVTELESVVPHSQQGEDCVARTMKRLAERLLEPRVVRQVMAMVGSACVTVRRNAAVALALLVDPKYLSQVMLESRGGGVLTDALLGRTEPPALVLRALAALTERAREHLQDVVRDRRSRTPAGAQLCLVFSDGGWLAPPPAVFPRGGDDGGAPARMEFLHPHRDGGEREWDPVRWAEQRGALGEGGDAGWDLEVVVEGRVFRAHRELLSQKSAAFRTMLEGSFREGGARRVELPDVRWEVFCCAMYELYTIDRRGLMDGASAQLAGELLHFADQWMLPELKHPCEHVLRKGLNQDTLLDLIDMAEAFQADHLMAGCIEYALGHFEQLADYLTECQADLPESGSPPGGSELLSPASPAFGPETAATTPPSVLPGARSFDRGACPVAADSPDSSQAPASDAPRSESERAAKVPRHAGWRSATDGLGRAEPGAAAEPSAAGNDGAGPSGEGDGVTSPRVAIEEAQAMRAGARSPDEPLFGQLPASGANSWQLAWRAQRLPHPFAPPSPHPYAPQAGGGSVTYQSRPRHSPLMRLLRRLHPYVATYLSSLLTGLEAIQREEEGAPGSDCKVMVEALPRASELRAPRVFYTPSGPDSGPMQRAMLRFHAAVLPQPAAEITPPAATGTEPAPSTGAPTDRSVRLPWDSALRIEAGRQALAAEGGGQRSLLLPWFDQIVEEQYGAARAAGGVQGAEGRTPAAQAAGTRPVFVFAEDSDSDVEDASWVEE